VPSEYTSTRFFTEITSDIMVHYLVTLRKINVM
jgi:hypothetical protein